MRKCLLAALELEKSVDFLDRLEETKGLVEACEIELIETVTQKRRSAHPATFFGEGKVNEMIEKVEEQAIDCLIIASRITPSQKRHLKEMFKIEVMDRNDVILEIFAKRAKTKEAKLQVELATLKYQLPYVINTGQNFSRMGGKGGAKNKGEGEKQLELDRRKIETQIQNVSTALKEVKQSRTTMRRKRNKSELGLVAIVGYTNAGKSTLLNAMLEMSESEEDKKVFVKDMLFATLDTAVRKIEFGNKAFLLSDTVGFVSDLPHQLIDAFHSTLEEVVEADLILHVVDESSEDKLNHMEVTNHTLEELKAAQTPCIYVHNKCDKAEPQTNHANHMYVSALTHQGIEELMECIVSTLYKDYKQMYLFIPYSDSEQMKWLNGLKLIHMVHQELGNEIVAEVNDEIYARLKKYEVCE